MLTLNLFQLAYNRINYGRYTCCIHFHLKSRLNKAFCQINLLFYQYYRNSMLTLKIEKVYLQFPAKMFQLTRPN